MLTNILSIQFLNNTGRDYLIALVVFIATLIILKIFQMIVLARLKKLASRTKNDFDDVVIGIVSRIKPPFYFLVAIYLSVRSLALPSWASQVIRGLFLIVLVYEAVNAIQKIIEYAASKAMTRENEDRSRNESSIKTLSIIVKIVLWSIGLILVLGNLGVDVTSLIAGLGIGGVAVALALQNVLGDIFASFSIIIDKPFQTGDFIKVGDDMGVVEKIGIKSTRLRTLDGQQLIVSNKELTDARVQNFKRLEKRRALLNLGVVYETDQKKLGNIPGWVEEIVKSIEHAEFDRCHFKGFGDFSLDFELAYYVDRQDYNEYLDVAQQVNLKVFNKFNQEKVEFAYPTHVEYQKKA